MMVRRTALDAVGGWGDCVDLVAAEDYDLWLRLLTVGPILTSNEVLATYRRLGEHRISARGARLFLHGADVACSKIQRLYPNDRAIRRLCNRRRAGWRRNVAWEELVERNFFKGFTMAFRSIGYAPFHPAAYRMMVRAILRIPVPS